MHLEARLVFGVFGAGFVASRLLPTALAFVVDFLTGVGLVAALSEQFLLEQRPSKTNEPHSQNSANHITPFFAHDIKAC